MQGFAATIEFPRHVRGVQRCCLVSRNRVRLPLPPSPLLATLLMQAKQTCDRRGIGGAGRSRAGTVDG